MKYAIKKKIMAGLILPPLMFACGVILGKNVSAMHTRYRENLVDQVHETLEVFQKEYNKTEEIINEVEKHDWWAADEINGKKEEITAKVNAALNFNGTFNDGTKQKNWQNACDDPLSKKYGGIEFSAGEQPPSEWGPGGTASDTVIENRDFFPNCRLEEAPSIIMDATDELKKFNDSLFGNNGQ